MQAKKTWLLIFIIVVILIVGVVGSIFILTGNRNSEAKIAEIYQDGVLIESIDLLAVTESYTITITDDNGGENVVLVEYGKISMQSANCPDGLCVNQGTISDGLIPIVCLPHRVIISIATDDDVDADVAAY